MLSTCLHVDDALHEIYFLSSSGLCYVCVCVRAHARVCVCVTCWVMVMKQYLTLCKSLKLEFIYQMKLSLMPRGPLFTRCGYYPSTRDTVSIFYAMPTEQTNLELHDAKNK